MEQINVHKTNCRPVWQIKYTLLLLCYNASIPISSFRINQIRTQKRIILWIHPNKCCLSTQKQLYITHYWWVSTLVSHLQCTVNKNIRISTVYFLHHVLPTASSNQVPPLASLSPSSAALLQEVHALGKASKNVFSSSQNFSSSGGGDPSSPSVSFKAHLIRLIGNLCHRHPFNQNQVRGGMWMGRWI